MGESDRYSDYKAPRKTWLLGQEGNALVALITINIIFFLLLLTIKVIYFFFQQEDNEFATQVLPYFAMPAQLTHLATKPWTILTYMFSHFEVMTMLSNMLWLWAFGFILQSLTGNEKLIPVYIYGGVVGALVFVLSYYSIPPLRPFVGGAVMLGGNAATMAVALATTTLTPQYRFFRNLNGGIPIWVLTAVYVLIDFAGVASLNAAFSLSHLGGAVAGFVFIFLLKKDIDTGAWMVKSYHWLMHLFTPNDANNKTNIKQKVFYNTEGRKPFKIKSNVTPQRVDEILDKINQKGYHLLTEEEKNILKRASEEDI